VVFDEIAHSSIPLVQTKLTTERSRLHPPSIVTRMIWRHMASYNLPRVPPLAPGYYPLSGLRQLSKLRVNFYPPP
jgi:hypothetical protein